MATVYSDRGQGVRPPVVFYNRANEAAAQLKPGDFDLKSILSSGVSWFHNGGIFAALSKTTGEVISTLALIGYEPSSKRLRIESLHAGVTVDDIRGNTGFEFLLTCFLKCPNQQTRNCESYGQKSTCKVWSLGNVCGLEWKWWKMQKKMDDLPPHRMLLGTIPELFGKV